MTISRFVLAAALGVAAAWGGSARADITIAVAGPMTGQYATFGEQFRRGAEAAVAELNAKGGVLGQKLKLEVGDDVCDPKQAVAVANQFASRGVIFVAGHYCSGSSIPASDVYAEQNILQISPASTNPALTERGLKNVFRVCGRDDQQGVIAGDFLLSKYKDKKIAIVHDKTAYGKGLADETKKAINGGGLTEVMYESITAGERDYSALISKMKAAAVDVLYFGGYHTEAGLIVRQMREAGLNALLIGGDALVTEEFWAITGPSGAGTINTFGPDPRNEPTAKAIVDQFRKAGYEPEGYTLNAYASVQVFAQAAEKAKSTKIADLLTALHGETFKTVIGDVKFDAKGDVQGKTYVFYVWQDGKYKEM